MQASSHRSGFDSLAQKPLAAFPSWFPKLTCDWCGKDRMVNARAAAPSALAPLKAVAAVSHRCALSVWMACISPDRCVAR